MIQDVGQLANHKTLDVTDPKYTPSESHREVASDRRRYIKHVLLYNSLGNTELHIVSTYERGICEQFKDTL